MNEVYLMGNLTKDVEIRYTKTNKMVCTYTVACSERFIADDWFNLYRESELLNSNYRSDENGQDNA